MKRILSLLALATVFSVAAYADVPPINTPKPTPVPKEKKSLDSMLYISIRKDAREARLLIPKDQLKQLRAELDALDGESDSPAFLTFSRGQMIVGGLFLSLAAVFGGVWFSRFSKKQLKPNKTAVAAGLLLFGSGAFATLVFANIGPPLDARRITGRIFTDTIHQYKQASGRIKIELTDDDYGIQLIVPDVPKEKSENVEK